MTHFVNVEPHHNKSTNKNNTISKEIKIQLCTITNCTTLYHTYQLLYYEGHIPITYNPTIIKEQIKIIQ